MKTVAAVFPTLAQAGQACRDLEHVGIPRDQISLIAGNDAGKHDEYVHKIKNASASTESGAASGAALGGGFGLLVTLATIAIPGVGPIVALGPIFTVLLGLSVGAAAGGLIGTLHSMGIEREDAPLYEEAIKRGEVMVAAIVDEQFQAQAVDVMRQNGSRDVRNELDPWAETQWSGPKTDPHPYPSDSAKYESGT